MSYDLVVRGGTVVLPDHGEMRADVAVRNGTVAALGDDLSGGEEYDATGKFVLPGAVDAHYHLGIYQSLAQDAFEETRSSLVGGATTVLSYFRTGSHYLDKTGPYDEILPEVLAAVAGRSHTDYSFHLAPMTKGQVDEIGRLATDDGIASFKYYMFYKGLNLAGDSTDAAAYTMSDTYDLGHLFSIMEAVTAANEASPGRISLSIHCEQSELITLFTERVQKTGRQDLGAYSDARPPLTERVAVGEATALAAATRCPVNLLHLSSAEAVAAAAAASEIYPGLDLRRETTLHHLALAHDELEGHGGKVNPPIRSRRDVEALWDAVRHGWIDWVASDHACCMEEQKGDDLWPALPGFGGTALIYPVLISEGAHRRGLPISRVVELVSTNPARAFGLYTRKGTLALGSDADIAVVDPHLSQVVTPELLHSAQDHTPFAGRQVTGWPVATFLRGRRVFEDGEVVGDPHGEFVPRPVGR